MAKALFVSLPLHGHTRIQAQVEEKFPRGADAGEQPRYSAEPHHAGSPNSV